jgi:hypothetical protein
MGEGGGEQNCLLHKSSKISNAPIKVIPEGGVLSKGGDLIVLVASLVGHLIDLWVPRVEAFDRSVKRLSSS